MTLTKQHFSDHIGVMMMNEKVIDDKHNDCNIVNDCQSTLKHDNNC